MSGSPKKSLGWLVLTNLSSEFILSIALDVYLTSTFPSRYPMEPMSQIPMYRMPILKLQCFLLLTCLTWSLEKWYIPLDQPLELLILLPFLSMVSFNEIIQPKSRAGQWLIWLKGVNTPGESDSHLRQLLVEVGIIVAFPIGREVKNNIWGLWILVPVPTKKACQLEQYAKIVIMPSVHGMKPLYGTGTVPFP